MPANPSVGSDENLHARPKEIFHSGALSARLLFSYLVFLFGALGVFIGPKRLNMHRQNERIVI